MGQVKRSGVGGGKREEKTPARKHCENEKHPLLIIALDLCSGNEKPTNQHRTTIVPEAPFTSDKIKINTSVVYIMQAGSFFTRRRVLSSDLSVNDYCRLCTNSLKVKYESNLGKQGHSSSVFFLPSPSFRVTIFTLPNLPPS